MKIELDLMQYIEDNTAAGANSLESVIYDFAKDRNIKIFKIDTILNDEINKHLNKLKTMRINTFAQVCRFEYLDYTYLAIVNHHLKYKIDLDDRGASLKLLDIETSVKIVPVWL